MRFSGNTILPCILVTSLSLGSSCVPLEEIVLETPWRMHVIDDGTTFGSDAARGADGVRVADMNGDGLLDVVTGWEQSGHIRVAFHPGVEAVRGPWPVVTVGRVGSPEDAVPVDLDGDGAKDIVSCTEGSTRSVFVHWAPADPARIDVASAWRTEPIPELENTARWMFSLPMDIDGDGATDLVVGAKDDGAQVGWLRAPANPSSLSLWSWHPLKDVGWVMSLRAEDMDGDGDDDIVLSDRKGDRRGCYWLENPGTGFARTLPWTAHRLGSLDREFMFLDIGDLDGDGLRDVAVATFGRELIWYQRLDASGLRWREHVIDLPERAGIGKGVAIGDIDGDGANDLVVTSERAGDGRIGVYVMSALLSAENALWRERDISGPAGAKFDRVELIDLDEDGDLDVLTCEESANLGVVWYENPQRPE